jgi:hypothetical protein
LEEVGSLAEGNFGEFQAGHPWHRVVGHQDVNHGLGFEHFKGSSSRIGSDDSVT